MPLKLEKRENRLFLQDHFAFTLSNLVEYFMVLSENDSILNATFLGIYKDNRKI